MLLLQCVEQRHPLCIVQCALLARLDNRHRSRLADDWRQVFKTDLPVLAQRCQRAKYVAQLPNVAGSSVFEQSVVRRLIKRHNLSCSFICKQKRQQLCFVATLA